MLFPKPNAAMSAEAGHAMGSTEGDLFVDRVENRFVLLLSLLAPVVVGVGLVRSHAPRVTLLGLPLLGAAIGTFSQAKVTVSHDRVQVALGPGGLLRRSLPLDELSRADVGHVRPLAYGGWGYRLLPGFSAIVISRGEGLRLVRRRRRDLVITLPRATQAAAVVNEVLTGAR